MKYSEKWGNTVDIAVEFALADLKLTREQVRVTVLEEPSKGFFGIGSKLAKVRVEEIEAEKPAQENRDSRERTSGPSEKQPERQPEKQPKKEEGKEIVVIEKCGVEGEDTRASRYRKSKPRRTVKTADEDGESPEMFEEVKVLGERPGDLAEAEDHPVKDFLEDVLRQMGLNMQVRVFVNADSIYADLEGEDSGTVIGKRGATLDSLQYLASLMANKGKSGYVRVVIDAEGYRQKRERTLERLAFKQADRVSRSGRSVKLEPMNPYERKVIHTALQARKEVTTRSEGEEPYRRVIIEPVK